MPKSRVPPSFQRHHHGLAPTAPARPPLPANWPTVRSRKQVGRDGRGRHLPRGRRRPARNLGRTRQCARRPSTRTVPTRHPSPFEASAKAKEANADVLIIDTGPTAEQVEPDGRASARFAVLPKRTCRWMKCCLCFDATTGQNGMAQAKVSPSHRHYRWCSPLAVPAKGAPCQRAEGARRAGQAFVGPGEGPDDLAPSIPEGFVDGILA